MFINKSKKVTIKNPFTIEGKVSFLQEPSSYPFPVNEIKVIETHMSWVFLVNDFVYKLKKPVKYSLFDHRSLQSRMNNSFEEIRINKCLAIDIFLDVVPLVVNEKGNLQINGQGAMADWLVKMKRIPEENMLDYAIQHNCVDNSQLNRAAILLTEFYKTTPAFPMTLAEYTRKLESEILFNYSQLANPLFELPPTLLKELTEGLRAFVSKRQSLFDKRIADKKIVDAHGDLRPEHICLAPHPAIIDRLEFSKELRKMDMAEELSFLSMECEMMGNNNAGQLFFDVYRDLSRDNIPKSLVIFFKIKKACLRAYLVARHVEESRYQGDPKWLTSANAYLQLAKNYLPQIAT